MVVTKGGLEVAGPIYSRWLGLRGEDPRHGSAGGHPPVHGGLRENSRVVAATWRASKGCLGQGPNPLARSLAALIGEAGSVWARVIGQLGAERR